MDSYQRDMKEEKIYLEKTLNFIKKALDSEIEKSYDKRDRLIASRKDMWENTSHSASDFTKLTEMNQYLPEINNRTADYENLMRHIEKYKRILGSPYFGRFDFLEDGMEAREKIYIGLYNVMDPKTHDIFVYDWRAPISSIFYNSELGRASYNAPIGSISGEISLKRQYKIRDSKLEYFFDCSVRIGDEMLQEVLSLNSSAKMRNIVETIQKEQNIIIRDTDNELLIVQGVAGSGKTSVALHRVAYLLYEGVNSDTDSNNIVIISPNAVFSKYISSVLPELGEENVEQITFDDIAVKCFEGRLTAEKWNKQVESVILSRDGGKPETRSHGIEFKGSGEFVRILDRLMDYYERNMIAFEDIYYGGEIIETRQQMKNFFLSNKINLPMAKRLKRIENIILEKVYIKQKDQLDKIRKIVYGSGGHEFEIKSFSRLLSLKKTKAFTKRLKKFMEVDYLHIYNSLFSDSRLFDRLTQGLKLPADIGEIIKETRKSLEKGYIYYEDCAPLMYLKLKVEGCELFDGIKQVVIDEAQDYYQMQYEVFKLLFKEARYTVLGDVYQAIEKDVGNSLYDSVIRILDKNSTVRLSMNKSYRASYEINTFAWNLLNNKQDFISFERHEAEPAVVFKENQESINQAVVRDIESYFKQGYETVAVICKTQQEAQEVHESLNRLVNISLVGPYDGEIKKGAMVIPAYIAKGLEFDVVIVYNSNQANYSSEFDRKLLYIACTRALHRLIIYYSGERSKWLV